MKLLLAGIKEGKSFSGKRTEILSKFTKRVLCTLSGIATLPILLGPTLSEGAKGTTVLSRPPLMFV